TALYRAKAQGRGRCVEFDASMHDRAVELLQLETALRRALERNEFHLHYQPVVSLTSGQITGAEALLRWKHPERGLVPPMEFVPLAEETGLIVDIGAWVLREACRQMKEWQQRLGQPALEIGVNLSSRQFQGPGLVAEVAEVSVNATLARASSLDMDVVAEGVETEQQLEQLRKMHCAYAQGYHLSRPVEAPQFESLVGTRRSWAA